MLNLHISLRLYIVSHQKRKEWKKEIVNINILRIIALLFRVGFINIKGRWLMLPSPGDFSFIPLTISVLKNFIKNESEIFPNSCILNEHLH